MMAIQRPQRGTYNAEGNIESWTQKVAENTPLATANTPVVYGFGYDNTDQLTSAVLSNGSTQAILHKYYYGYTPSGSRANQQIDSQVNQETSNSLNQVTLHKGGGPTRFSGILNEAATVKVGGNPATVSGTTFTGNVNLPTGTNNVVVSATNNNGQTTSHTFRVTVSGDAQRTFAYDPEGNTLNDGNNTYEWDAENRLTAINYTGTQNRTEFTYDGLDRRVAIVEKTNGSVTSTKKFVWVGTEMAEERNGSNVVTKRFFEQGEKISGAAYYYTRDHLGSIREMTNASGQVVSHNDYDPYGQSTVTHNFGTVSPDFGFTGHYFHAPSGFNLTLYRAYNPSSGRWLSRDPIGENGGINLYGYVYNSPVNYIDRLGLSARDVALIQSLFAHSLENMNDRNMRLGGPLNAPVSGLAQLFEDAWNGLTGQPMTDATHHDSSCHGQAENLKREFQKYLDHQNELFDDHWKMEKVMDGGHFYDVMHSDNPADPDVKLDPFWGYSKPMNRK